MQTKYGFTLYSLQEFEGWLKGNHFNRTVALVQNHHTWLPDYGNFTGSNHFSLLKGMHDAHLERGFDMIAQNITTFPDGTIAVCRPLDRVPAGIKGANAAGVCIEHLGNFDSNDLAEIHREAAITVNALLCRKFSLSPSTTNIVYHHWYDLNSGQRTNGSGTTKTCPGKAFFGGNSIQNATEKFIPFVQTRCSQLEHAAPPPEQWIEARVTALSSLNVRSAPTSDSKITGSLRRGALVRVYEQRLGWGRIHPSEERWASIRYLAFIG